MMKKNYIYLSALVLIIAVLLLVRQGQGLDRGAAPTKHEVAMTPLPNLPGTNSYRIVQKTSVESHSAERDLVEELSYIGQLDDIIQKQNKTSAEHLVRFKIGEISWTSNGTPVASTAALIEHFAGPHGFTWTEGSEALQLRLGVAGDARVAKVVEDSLNYLWLVLPDSEQSTWERSERDTAGRYRAVYQRTLDGQAVQITKQWAAYYPSQPDFAITVDPSSQVRWTLGPDLRLNTAKVNITLSFHGPGLVGHAQVHLELERDDHMIPVAQNPPAKAAPAARGTAPEPAAGAATDAVTTTALIQKVKAVGGEAKSEETYALFRELKERWRDAPEEIVQVEPLLKELSGKDAGQRKQISLVYGALAQTADPRAVQVLTAMLKDPPDADAAVQAAAALGSSPVPDPAALDALLTAGQTLKAPQGREAAVLAYGSAASRLVDPASDLTAPLLNLAKTSDDAGFKETVLAAMGNQGAPAYLPFIQERAASSSESERATALYSARAYVAPEAVEWLTQAAVKDDSDTVKSEAIKALSSQLTKRDNLDQITRVALSAKKADTQLAVLHVLLNNQGQRPESAAAQLEVLKNGTTFPEVKAALQSQAKQPAH